MTRLRVVSHTGATSAVVLLLTGEETSEGRLGYRIASHEVSSNAANLSGCATEPGRSASRTIHVGNQLGPD
jgi:hypothetical protein